jgi:hypothetical protein
MKLALVYQNGLANVVDITRCGDMPALSPLTDESKTYGGQRRKRLLQASFTECECFAHGAATAGATVAVFHSDKLGDVLLYDWDDGPGARHQDKKRWQRIPFLIMPAT